jgi:rod shape-determining protein MreD
MDAFWQRLDSWLKAAMPSVTALLMALLSVGAWPIPHLGSVMPPLAFIALFYWSAHRPDLFPPAAAFATGLLNDLVNGHPLGLTALLFTGAHQIIWRQRGLFAGHSFLMLWSGFALAATLFMFAEWLVMGLLAWQMAPLLPVLIQTVLAIVLFPLPCWIFIQLQRSVLNVN